MQKKVLQFLAGFALVGLVFAGISFAQITTRAGDATLMTAGAGGSTTVTQDQSVWPVPNDRRGLYVTHYTVPAAGISNQTINITDWDIPQGTILLNSGVVEAETAFTTSDSVLSLRVGGQTFIDSEANPFTAGQHAVANTPTTTTSAGPIQLVVGDEGVNITNGVIAIYLPVILGNVNE